MPLHHANNSTDKSNPQGIKGIALCVDDFGLHEGVNEAALSLAKNSRISAIGCMVGAPTWRQSHGALSSIDRQRVDVGLHLDFIEYPLNLKSRHSLRAVIAKSYTGALNAASVREEIAAQLNAFEKAMGAPPDFIDGHQHVHQLPVIRTQLLAELELRYATARPWLRNTRGSKPSLSLSEGIEGFMHWFKPQVIQALGAAALMSNAAKLGYARNKSFGGIYNFSTDPNRYPRLMASWLKIAQPGELLMCHPSAPSAHAASSDVIYAARQIEFAFLGSAQFTDLLMQAHCEIKPLSQLISQKL
jgi:chitin disaccharide deacetylase